MIDNSGTVKAPRLWTASVLKTVAVFRKGTGAGIVDPGRHKIENNERNLGWFQRCASSSRDCCAAGITDAGYNI